jgi:site-specific DNA recombinase
LRAAVYIRVSTDEQAEHGYSLSAQEESCRRKVQEICPGAEVVVYADEGASGTEIDRPALNRLRADVASGLISLVVCLDPDRLSRNLAYMLILSEELKKKATVAFVNANPPDTPEGKLMLSVLGALAEFELHKIRERSVMGRRRKATLGGIANPPVWVYGYRFDPERDALVPVQPELETVRWIFESVVVRGWSARRVAEELNARGVRSPGRGKLAGKGLWYSSTVRRILSNPIYAGKLRQFAWHKGRLRPDGPAVPVPVEPVVDEHTWRVAQSCRSSHRKGPGPGHLRTSGTLLGGFARCGVCGRSMYVTGYRRGTETYAAYMCASRHAMYRRFGVCGNCYYNVRHVDEAVWAAVREVLCLSEDELRRIVAEHTGGYAEARNELEHLRRRSEELRKARENLASLVARGFLSLGDAEEALRGNEAEARALGERISRVSALMSEPPDVAHVLAQVSRVLDGTVDPPMAVKRSVLRLLAVEVRLSPGTVECVPLLPGTLGRLSLKDENR